jgi:hypothetical protein
LTSNQQQRKVGIVKSIARREFPATNGNTLRFDLSPEGDVKVSILKDKKFQGVAQIAQNDVTSDLRAVFAGIWS